MRCLDSRNEGREIEVPCLPGFHCGGVHVFFFGLSPFFFLRVAKSAVAFACALLVLLPTPGNVGRSPVANGEPRNTMTWGLDTCFLSLCLFLLFPSGYLVTTFLSSPLPHGSWFDVVFH